MLRSFLHLHLGTSATMALNISLTSNFSSPPAPIIQYPSCEHAATHFAPLNATIDSIVFMMDDAANTSHSDLPTALEWIGWYYSNDSDIFLDQVFNCTLESCKKELCHDLKWEGNADLAGRGVSIFSL